ncbi:hypothetical protein [Pseudomonas sp. B33.4]|uniref:hypothetical protein n=1 Tax=Pseudomonas sp. B33.4 TaxID=3104265 RepID=UPI002ADED976|nr:hypothetical protein [Pseudomonas sp. B33.4]
MRGSLRWATLGSCLALTLGCSAVGKPNSFTFVPDFPADFTYELKAIYLPAQGETCTLPVKRDFWVSFNKPGMEYISTAEIELYRTESECPLALNHVEIKIIGVIGRDEKRSYSGYDYASFAVRPELLERQMGTFGDDGAGEFFGECQWLFRTVGPKRYITKILTCKKMDEQGNVRRGRPSTAYTLTQLSGKTVRLKVKLADEEKPAFGDTWVKVPGGWKRCMGKGFEDQDAFCFGNYEDFSTFKMLDERVCTIYPGCTENKEETQ